MPYLSSEKADAISADYVNFKMVAEKNKSPAIRCAFKTFQESCVKSLEGLIVGKLYKYKNFSNYPDLKQDAYEALFQALNTFNPNKGSFIWWANRYIKTRISRSANAHSTIKYPMNIAKMEMPYKVNDIPIMIDLKPSPLQEAEVSEYYNRLHDAIEKLSDEQKTIINMTYGCNGVRQQPISYITNIIGMSRTKYIRLLKSAKEEIYNHFKELE